MNDKTSAPKWDEARTEQLLNIVGSTVPVAASTVEAAAVALGVSVRSVASKLRNLEIEVVSLAKATTSAFSDSETNNLSKYVTTNSGAYTYKEIAENFANGKFSPKQIQGKILSLELTEHIKPSEKVEVARTYTPAEESKFISLVNSGAFIEDIASALNKSVQSVRGKALSMLRQEAISKIPAQKESHAKESVDGIEALGDAISKMTVEQIATATGKTTRGVKTALTRRGITVVDHDGEGKRAKADATKAGE
jgi:hypothetical protein